MKFVVLFYSIFAILIFAPSSLADKNILGSDCDNSSFLDQTPNFSIAKINGNKGEKVHFIDSEGRCPDSVLNKCQLKSYLIPGDEVVTAHRFKNWICSQFITRKKKGKISKTIAWLETKKLQFIEVESNSNHKNWVGEWKDDAYNRIIIKEGKDGAFQIIGNAIWPDSKGSAHTGDIESIGKPNGNRIVLKEEDCILNLVQTNQYLFADDNFRCGGLNVSFDGVYIKSN